MKLTIKLLLIFCILLAGLYAATPLWVSYILANQLPQDWKLESLESGFPGFSGIDIHSLQVKGAFPFAELGISASDIRFDYRGLKTNIGFLSVDIHMRANRKNSVDNFTLDDLSLPVTKLTGRMPTLSILKSRVTLYQLENIQLGKFVSTPTLIMNLDPLSLIPRLEDSFKLVTRLSLDNTPQLEGRVEIVSNTDALRGELRFTTNADSLPWLTVVIEQQDQPNKTNTRVRAIFNTQRTGRQWLDSIVDRSTGGRLTHINGKLELSANFSGRDLQNVEQLSLTTKELQMESNGRVLTLQASLVASRSDEKVAIRLSEPVSIQIQDNTGRVDDLLNQVIPGLDLTPGLETNGRWELGSNSRFEIQPGKSPSLRYWGDTNIGLTRDGTMLGLKATDLQLDLDDFSQPDSITMTGPISFNWDENKAFRYSSGDWKMAADGLSISYSGQLIIDDHSIRLERTDDFKAQFENLLATQPKGPGLRMEHYNMQGQLEFAGSKSDSDGWNLDPVILTGNLSTKTRGLAFIDETETWTGFDLDTDFSLLNDTAVTGAGTLIPETGPTLPVEFDGNLKAGRWNIRLPSTTISLTQLGSWLKIAHVELPPSVQLTDGFIDLQGDIEADEQIRARMTINGYDMAASMQESTVQDASFRFSSVYDQKVSASGPVSVGAIALAGGIDVTDVRADLEFEGLEAFGLQHLFAEVFDGQLKLDDLRYSTDGIEDTTVVLSAINLEKLFVFADIEGLQGTGALEISLPMGSDPVGIHVDNGTFTALGPGRLAYKKQGLAAGNIGLQALENFHYQHLSGTVDYQSDGAYTIAIRLEGNNPDLYGGHPVVFNLNINGALPEFFEALFMTGSFDESILKQLRVN